MSKLVQGKFVQTAVVGVTGYAGTELARLLTRHPRLAGKTPIFAGRDGGEQTRRVMGSR